MLVLILVMAEAAASLERPFMEPEYGAGQVDELKRRVADAMALSPQELYTMVPEQSGIRYCGCPHCDGGSQESDVLDWRLRWGKSVKCRFCGMEFPNDRYPENRELEIIAPSGARQVYRWYEDDQGRQYHYQGRQLYDRMIWCRAKAYALANLYALTGEAAYGDRAAAIVGRMAQVFPDYAVRYDYPFKPVRFFPADQKYPYDDLPPYRRAKLFWWGYGDIPDDLARAYDLLAAGDAFERMEPLLGPDIEACIESDLIRLAYAFVAANPDTQENMAPRVYRNMIVAGRVLNDPAIVHDAVGRVHAFLRDRFTFDGWWKEGSPSYHWQVLNYMEATGKVARGYSDPPGWEGPRFADLDLERDAPMLAKAIAVGNAGLLPDGRLIPINDTWWHAKRAAPASSVSRLWPGLGHAVLGAGAGSRQVQAHLNWSRDYGHAHADNASVIFWALGRELASDIGYTHTRYCNWTLNTASHNTVVVDERSQLLWLEEVCTKGNLRFFDDGHPHVRAIDLDASRAYAQCPVYRRRLVLVHQGEGRDYLVDLFDVEGGGVHDYFWHGSADEPGTFESSQPLESPVRSLVPAWGGTAGHTGENCFDIIGEKHHACLFLERIFSAAAAGPWSAVWRYEGAGLRSHFFPEEGTTIYRLDSPAIRGAQENDAELPNYVRHGIMERHLGGTSRFAAVHEPFGEAPWLEGASFAGGRFAVRHDGKAEEIVWEGDRLTVVSEEGWRYDSGAPHEGSLLAVERGERFAFRTDLEPPPIRFVRINFLGGHSLGYRVAGVEAGALILEDDPGFEYHAAGGEARFLCFPHDVFPGVPRVTAYW